MQNKDAHITIIALVIESPDSELPVTVGRIDFS